MIYHTLREIREGFLEKLSSKGCMAEGMGDMEKDQLHNSQGPVQNKDAGPLLQEALRLSREGQQSVKGSTGSL